MKLVKRGYMMDSSTIYNITISFIISIAVFWIKKKLDDFNNRQRLAQALLTELETLFLHYKKMSDGQSFLIVKENCLIVNTMLVDDSFLTVYDHNTDKIGLFDKKSIAEVVKLYTAIRGYIYSIKTWNDIITQKDDVVVKIMYNKSLEKQLNEIIKQYNISMVVLENIANQKLCKFLLGYIF